MSFHSETLVKAVRKRHLCDGCQSHIEIGEAAQRWVGMTDGDFGTAIYHPDCRKAEIDLNNEILGYAYGDDWWPLSEIDSDDHPWLIDAYPTVAARMGMSPPDQSALRQQGDAALRSVDRLEDPQEVRTTGAGVSGEGGEP